MNMVYPYNHKNSKRLRERPRENSRKLESTRDMGPIKEWYISWASRMAPHCSFPSWLAPEHPAAPWEAARSFERPPQQQESSSPASTRYFHAVTGPWKQSRRRPCPERWQSRSQGRRADGNHRHPVKEMVSRRKVSECVVLNLQRRYQHPRRYHREPRSGCSAGRRRSCSPEERR